MRWSLPPILQAAAAALEKALTEAFEAIMNGGESLDGNQTVLFSPPLLLLVRVILFHLMEEI